MSDDALVSVAEVARLPTARVDPRLPPHLPLSPTDVAAPRNAPQRYPVGIIENREWFRGLGSTCQG